MLKNAKFSYQVRAILEIKDQASDKGSTIPATTSPA